MKILIIILMISCCMFPCFHARADESPFPVDFEQLREDANLYYKISSAIFAAFTSQTSISQGTFTAKYDDEPDAHFDVFKFPVPYYFNRESNIQPFIKLSYGYGRLSQRYYVASPFVEDIGKTEKLRVQTHSIGFGTGIRWEYMDGFTIEPSIGLAYSHIHRKITSRTLISEKYLELYPSLERDLYDTTVEVYSIAPTLKHKLEYPIWIGNIGVDLHFIYQYASSFRSKSKYAKFSSNSKILYGLLNYEFQTGWSVFEKPISVEPFTSITYFLGDIKDGMDMNHMNEFGLNFIFDVGNVKNLFERLSIGGSYIIGHDFYGWKFGITFI